MHGEIEEITATWKRWEPVGPATEAGSPECFPAMLWLLSAIPRFPMLPNLTEPDLTPTEVRSPLPAHLWLTDAMQ